MDLLCFDKIPISILPSCENPDLILISKEITFWSSIDLSAPWFIHLLFNLEKHYKCLKKANQFKDKKKVCKAISKDPVFNSDDTDELTLNLALMNIDVFRLIITVLQHICARQSKESIIIRKGIYVFYAYIYYYFTSYDEDAIIQSIRNNLPSNVQIVTIEEAFQEFNQKFSFVEKGSEDYSFILDDGDDEEEFLNVDSGFDLVDDYEDEIICSVDLDQTITDDKQIQPSSSSSSSSFSSSLPFSSQSVPSYENFDAAEDYKTIFLKNCKKKLPVPKFIIKVPWTQALEIVADRSALHIEKGMAFLNYTQVATWMEGRWNKAVSQWMLWDSENIIQPHFSKAKEMFSSVDIRPPGTSMQAHQDSIHQRDNRAIYTPLINAMKTSLFTSLLDSRDTDSVVSYVYDQMIQDIFAVKKKKKDESDMNRSTFVSDILDEEELVYHPSPFSATGKLMADYGCIMPPCIRNLAEKHIAHRTHLIFQERFTFFCWAFKVSIPLEIVNAFWYEMVDNDINLPEREKRQVKHVPSQIYKSQQQKKNSNDSFKFFKCETMQTKKLCPISSIGDIEDIGTLKDACGNHIYNNFKTKPRNILSLPGKYKSRWRPTVVTAVLIKINQ